MSTLHQQGTSGAPVAPLLDFEPVAPFAQPLVIRAVCDGLRLGLSTIYDPNVVQCMNDAGFKWFRFRRMWVIPVADAKPALELLSSWDAAGLAPSRPSPFGQRLATQDVRDKAALAWRHQEPHFFAELLDVQLIPLEDSAWACSFEFDALMIRAMRHLHGRFHKHAGAWEIRQSRERIVEAIKAIAGVDLDYVFVHEHAMRLESLVSRQKSEMPISVPGSAPAFLCGGSLDDTPQGDGFLSVAAREMEYLDVDEGALAEFAERCSLRSYQVEGVRFLAERTGALLADDMGVGKSRQATVAARLVSGVDRILVMCPASLCINWEREIHAALPDAKVAFISEGLEACSKAQWIIANYERLGGLVKAPELRITCMLVDEAHNLKEYQAGRTRNAFLIAERIRSGGGRVYALTGTPILNREVELHTLLRMTGHPLGQMTLKDFRKEYCGSSEARARLAEKLSSWMLRRGKDVLKDLGKKIQQERYIQPAGGLASYLRILKDPNLMAMPKLTKLREHLELLKLDFIVESIQALPPGQKALVFVEFTATVELLQKALKDVGIQSVSIIGAHTPKQRMKAVDALQKDDETEVLIGTSKAAGVGLTLTRANYVFLMSLPWTNALKRQSEDRAYRSGNTNDVFVIIPVIAGTLDEPVMRLLGLKEEIEVDVVEALRVAIAA